MKLIYTDRAVGDLESIADYLTARSPQGARRVRAAIESALATLMTFPHSGRMQTTGGLRKIGTRRYPYAIYYTVDDAAGVISIMSVQHTSRAPEFYDT